MVSTGRSGSLGDPGVSAGKRACSQAVDAADFSSSPDADAAPAPPPCPPFKRSKTETVAGQAGGIAAGDQELAVQDGDSQVHAAAETPLGAENGHEHRSEASAKEEASKKASAVLALCLGASGPSQIMLDKMKAWYFYHRRNSGSSNAWGKLISQYPEIPVRFLKLVEVKAAIYRYVIHQFAILFAKSSFCRITVTW